MLLIHLALNLYFAAVLGVAGLDMAGQPKLFAATLARQQLLPSWSIAGTSYALPWAELIIAGALIMDIAPVVTDAVVVILFASFFVSAQKSWGARWGRHRARMG